MSEIRDGEDLWQWSRLEIRLAAFRRSTIPQKQFIIIIKCEFKLCKKKTTVIISDSMLKSVSGAKLSRYIEKKRMEVKGSPGATTNCLKYQPTQCPKRT